MSLLSFPLFFFFASSNIISYALQFSLGSVVMQPGVRSHYIEIRVRCVHIGHSFRCAFALREAACETKIFHIRRTAATRSAASYIRSYFRRLLRQLSLSHFSSVFFSKSKILSKYMPNFIFSLYVIYILYRLHFIEKEHNNNNNNGYLDISRCRNCREYECDVAVMLGPCSMPMSSKQQWHDDDMCVSNVNK